MYIIAIIILIMISAFAGIYFKSLNAIFSLDTIFHMFLVASILVGMFGSNAWIYITAALSLSILLALSNRYIHQNSRKDILLFINTTAMFLETTAVFIWTRIMNMPQKFYSFIFGSLFAIDLSANKIVFIFFIFFVLYIFCFHRQLIYILVLNRFSHFYTGDKYLNLIFFLFTVMLNFSLGLLVYLCGRATSLLIVLLPSYLAFSFVKKRYYALFLTNVLILSAIVVSTYFTLKNIVGIPDSILLSFFCILPAIFVKPNERKHHTTER